MGERMCLNKVLIVGGSEDLFEKWRTCIDNSGWACVGNTNSLSLAMTLFQLEEPSLVLCFIHLKEAQECADMLSAMRLLNPALSVLIILAEMQDELLAVVHKMRAQSFLVNPFDCNQLMAHLRMAAIQQEKNHPSVFQINDKELAVFRLLGQGCSNREIGQRLFISPHTVDSRRRKILQKMGVSSINQALCIGAKKGWL